MTSKPERKFFDQNITRKGKVLQDHLEGSLSGQPTAPSFSLIEFNLSGLCNRKCVFCPRADPSVFPNVNKHIPLELYEKTMSELAGIGYDGMMLYSGFSEPFLYNHIELAIKLSKQYCPNSRVESVTDGDFVTAEKLRALFDAGLDTLLISMYDGPEQVDHFQAIIAEAGLAENQVVLRKRWLPPEEHYGITLSNRSGMVDLSEVGVGALKEPLKQQCFYPFYQLMVDHDGAVLLCPHDWGKKLIVGNLNEQTILEIWNGRAVRRARMSLGKADRNFPPCNVCDVDGTLMGRPHFDNWMKYYGASDEIPA